ncbi:MAG: nickel-responsive transcriptional regulator NikR [Candidatus Margulisbacteria bacterium]|nr:nickel-responsive transcriptional regulator NikR [Candidatus Margulisiibacteriota bacterium]
MDKVIRYGISIDKELQQQFDGYIHNKGYSNRSEAIRDLIREKIISEEHRDLQSQARGSISLVYDHHVPELSSKLTDIQHNFQGSIISSMHVHLDHHNCMEVIVVKGSIKELEQLSNALSIIKGVKTGKLTLIY